MRTIDWPGVRCNVYEIDTFNLSDTKLLPVQATTHTTQGKPQLQRWETTFPHHGANIFINVCSAYLQLPPPRPTTFDDTNWLKFFGRKFFVAVKIVVEIFMAHAMLTNEDPARP